MRLSTVCLCLSLIGFGSAATANEPPPQDAPANPISKSEFVAAQNALFDKADKNFDGRVSPDETVLLNNERSRPKHVKAFQNLDKDNNGYVTLAEVKMKHDEFAERRARNFVHATEYFMEKYDSDGNGIITTQELDAHFDELNKRSDEDREKNAEKDFKGKDADKNGTIDLEEYIDSKMMKGPGNMKISFPNSPVFTRDTNHDSYITRTENQKFISDLFAAIDKDKDDIISAAEQSDRVFKLSERFHPGQMRVFPPKDLSSPKK